MTVEHPATAGGQQLADSQSDLGQLRVLKTHTVDLVLRKDGALVRLTGDIDLVAADDTARLLESLDRLTSVSVEIDLTDVRFMDTAGLQPLVEATRRRRSANLPPVLVADCSPAVLRLLNAAGIGLGPILDVEAWDELA